MTTLPNNSESSTHRRTLGFSSLLAASIGVIVGQLGMVSLLQGVGIGGAGFFVALLIAFALALANAAAYAEMALMMPNAGSLSSYAEAAIGNFPAILLVFAGYVTPVIFGIPVELILVDSVIAQILPGVLPNFGWAVAVLVVMTVLNILGTDIFAKVQTTLTFVMITFLLVTGMTALGIHGVTGTHGATPPPATVTGYAALTHDISILGTIALAFWVVVGSEFVTPLVTEARNAARDLPRAMIIGLVVVFSVQVLFALGVAFYIPREQLVTSPTPHLDYAVAVFGPGARIWFGVIALTATASLVNTVLASVPRMLHGMALNGQVFTIFKRLNPRYQTPVPAILFVVALPIIGLVWSRGDPGAIIPLTIAASVAWLLAYMTAQVSLIVLRRRYPHRARPFKIPGFPVTPILALAGMAYVVMNSSPAPELTRQIVSYTCIVLGLFAVVGALWVKLVMRKGLFEPILPAATDAQLLEHGRV
jgi:amino acid transporter